MNRNDGKTEEHRNYHKNGIHQSTDTKRYPNENDREWPARDLPKRSGEDRQVL
jgi:hypothetical protein